MKKNLLLILILLLNIIVFSQTNDFKLAYQYYRDGEYDKAAELYKSLYNKTKSSYYYSTYIQCLLNLKQYEKAEKEIKHSIKKDKKNLTLYVDLCNLYKTSGNDDKAEKTFNSILKRLPANRSIIVNVGNSFLNKRYYNWAEKVFLKGAKLIKQPAVFSYELANVYLYQRDYEKMINEYLSLLEISPNYISTVQNRLQSVVYNAKDDEIDGVFRKSLLKKIQKNPGNDIFSELFIWYLLQKKDFYGAFVQAKALDKRNREEGERILPIAYVAISNYDYETASQAYKYIIDKWGRRGRYYSTAKIKYAEALFMKITETNSSLQEIKQLDKLLSDYILELGKNQKSFSLIVMNAKIKGLYLHEYSKAIEILEAALKIPNVKKTEINKAKLLLGDLYLLKKEDWNATLIYAQVEQDNRDNPIGNEAKFKKAKLAYYTGQFLWAQAQLDVLKAATSKLIANDAFQLSLLISDNLKKDSTAEEVLKIYARADFDIYAKQDSIANLRLDSILNNHQSSSLIDDALYLKAKIAYRNQKYNDAIKYLQQIIETYSYSVLVDDALFMQANIYLYKLKDIPKAKELYKEIIINHKSSYYVSQSRKIFRELRGE